jgi:hypothetical protein
MKTDTAAEYLTRKIDEAIESTTRAITRGHVTTFDEYRRLTGVIQGLDAAKQLIGDLAKNLEDDND